MSTKKIVLTEKNTKVVQMPVIYNGQTQKIPIWILLDDDTVLSEGTDYELDSVLEGKWAAEYMVTVRGIGDYTGSFVAKGVILLPESPLITESVYREYLLGSRTRRAPIKFINYANSDYANFDNLGLPHPTYGDLVEEYERKHAPPQHPTVTVSVYSHQSSLHPCMDATCPERSCRVEMKDEVFRVALATGAVHSHKAQQYAAALVQKYVQSGADIFYDPNIQYQTAMEWCDTLLAECGDDPKKWNEELAILERRKASSTIAGLELFRDSHLLKIDTVGNSVVFILTLEEEWKINSFIPKLTSSEFKHTPYMLHSDTNIMIPEDKIQSYFSLYAKENTYSEDTAFLLASAPLAKFLLTPDSWYQQQDKLNDLIAISSQEGFDAFCTEQQSAGRLDDENITMMIVSVE